ncbi:MAG TPA: threonine ammonia-lyase [Solirubrobacteraceae bacterium]|nr:threonine ammonia-lyase [Solirubrobacteraceae bacterium]
MAATTERLESLDELRRVHDAASAIVRRTPVFTVNSLADRCGGQIMLKAECLQRTGSFKLRGALAKLATLDDDTRGVVAGSAGNHAQALAYAARTRDIPCTVHMPAAAAISKVAAVNAFGARVEQAGESVDACVERARADADEHGWVFVHPFDDLDIVRGQAGIGLELVDDIPDLAHVIVPIGGGGLASGMALAIKLRRPDVRITGVQAAACAAYPASLREHHPLPVASEPTIADGIAIKRPGDLTLGLIERYLDDLVTVEDDDIAEAMVLLLERGKLLAEGAGAASTAALLTGAVKPASRGVTVAIVSGGNVDANVLARLITRRETRVGRRLRLHTRVPDRPGGLAGLLQTVAAAEANVIELSHARDDADLPLAQTGVELLLELRGGQHADALVTRLSTAGYPSRSAQ